MKINRLTTLIFVLIFSVFTVQAITSGRTEFNSAAPQGCPDPAAFCEYAHPGSILTGYCANEEIGEKPCFDVSYGEEIRVVAADRLGDFPLLWFVWHKGDMVPEGIYPCELTGKHKTRVIIPEPISTCRADLVIGNYVYHEHFVSSPNTGCLGWVECRQNLLTAMAANPMKQIYFSNKDTDNVIW